MHSLRFKKIRVNTLGSVVGSYLRLELLDSSCILFSKELRSKTGLIFYLADFHGRNWRIPGSYFKKDSTVSLILHKNQPRSVIVRRTCSCQSCDISCRQRWVLKSGLRNYGSSQLWTQVSCS